MTETSLNQLCILASYLPLEEKNDKKFLCQISKSEYIEKKSAWKEAK